MKLWHYRDTLAWLLPALLAKRGIGASCHRKLQTILKLHITQSKTLKPLFSMAPLLSSRQVNTLTILWWCLISFTETSEAFFFYLFSAFFYLFEAFRDKVSINPAGGNDDTQEKKTCHRPHNIDAHIFQSSIRKHIVVNTCKSHACTYE